MVGGLRHHSHPMGYPLPWSSFLSILGDLSRRRTMTVQRCSETFGERVRTGRG